MPLNAITRIQGEGALFRAQSLPDVLAAAECLLPAKSKIWFLIWPGLPDHSMIVTNEGQEAVEDSLAMEFGGLKLPLEDRAFTSEKWGAWGGNQMITSLSSQFAWAKDTVILAPIRGKVSHVGILGISGIISAAQAKETSSILIVAIANLARLQGLHREATAYQFLLSCHKEALVVVGESGKIVGLTESGTQSLNMFEFGAHRSPLKEPNIEIPQKVLSAVLAGERPTAHGISVSASPFRGENFDLVEPMIVVELRAIENLASDGPFLDPGKVLTPAQKEVYVHVVRGLDYKEIGSALSISPHTVHRHVVEILRRLKCRDRVKLISRAINSGTPSSVEERAIGLGAATQKV